jgi:hypothetical protein
MGESPGVKFEKEREDRRGLYHRQAPIEINELTGVAKNLPTENRGATLSIMSAALSEFSELDQLRSIYRTLQRLQTNIQNTQSALRKSDLTQCGKSSGSRAVKHERSERKRSRL